MTDPSCSDADSADEDCASFNNLSRKQLEAESNVTILRGPYEHERIGECEETDGT
jgi:hypothetical protein